MGYASMNEISYLISGKESWLARLSGQWPILRYAKNLVEQKSDKATIYQAEIDQAHHLLHMAKTALRTANPK